MKFILLILFPILCSAQYVALNEVDEFTGDKNIQVNCMTGKKWWQSDNITDNAFYGVYLSTQYTASKTNETKTYYLTLNIHSDKDDMCISPETGKVILLFEDESTIECKQISETDCSHLNVVGKYSITPADINKLSTEKLTKFRVYTTEGYKDYDVFSKKNDLIKKTFSVLKTIAAK